MNDPRLFAIRRRVDSDYYDHPSDETLDAIAAEINAEEAAIPSPALTFAACAVALPTMLYGLTCLALWVFPSLPGIANSTIAWIIAWVSG